MIKVYTGVIGSGKTYSAINEIVLHLSKGGTVATNIVLNYDYISKYLEDYYSFKLNDEQYIFLKEDRITNFHRYTPQGTKDLPVLVIIDEAQLYFNSREYAKLMTESGKEFLAFLTQSRKEFTDVVFITQAIETIDKQLRIQIQFEVKCRDISTYEIPVILMKVPFKVIIQLWFDPNLPREGGKPLKRVYFWKNKKIFGCYNSFDLVKGGFNRSGQVSKKGIKIKKMSKKDIQIIIAIIILLLIGLSVYLYKKANKKNIKKAEIVSINSKHKKLDLNKKNQVYKKGKDIVYEEKYKGYYYINKKMYVITDNDIYYVGKVTKRGIIKKLFKEVAILKDFTGRELYIVFIYS